MKGLAPVFLYGLSGFLNNAAKYSGAGAGANSVSFAAQANQGAFNQNSANIANDLATQRLMEMYQYNSAQAALANNWQQQFWEQQAAYNSQEAEKARMFSEYMWNKQAEYNARETDKARAWQEQMEATKYQRAMADMETAGLNPILAYGGLSGGTGGVEPASVTGTSSAQASASLGTAAQASGSALNGISASEGNFTGAMDYYSGMFNMLGAAMGAMSSAAKSLATLGDNSTVNKVLDWITEHGNWQNKGILGGLEPNRTLNNIIRESVKQIFGKSKK